MHVKVVKLRGEFVWHKHDLEAQHRRRDERTVEKLERLSQQRAEENVGRACLSC
jgi:hypothetical protein